jgi:hypothetical protein
MQKDSGNIKLTQLIWWLFSCHIFLYACSNKEKPAIPIVNKYETYNAAKFAALLPYLQHGDIITRTGNDFTSQTLRKMQKREQTYSHCGIVCIDSNQIFVYHALGGEFNPKQTILKEKLQSFCNWEENFGIGIFRFEKENKKAVVKKAHELYLQKIPFDLHFSLKSTDSLYCAEFVQKSINSATNLAFDTSFIGDFPFFGVDNITLQQNCKPIFAIKYKL